MLLTGPWWYSTKRITNLLNGDAPGHSQISWGRWYKEPWYIEEGVRWIAKLSRVEAYYKCHGD